MTNIDKIRQEIERRKKRWMLDDLPISIGRYYEDRDLLAFIDSLPEESENHGCGVEFPHFGANYPDAKCIDGYLWDMDSYEDGIYTIGGDDPCPICNTEKWLKDVLDDEIFKTRDEALEYVKMLKSKYKHKDSLSEETSCIYDTSRLTPTPSVNIEDVARVQFASHAHVFDRKRKAVFDWEHFKEVAGIFYGFGKRDSLPEETKDAEQAAARYERENRQSVLASVDIVNAFMDGAKWQKEQDGNWLNEELMKAHLNGVMTGDRIAMESSPMPEDTVLFQKGVAEGRRLEREDNNKALAEMYGYEGGTESPLVKITFTIPKEQVKNLMPIKQGDVFGIENLTNKEGRR